METILKNIKDFTKQWKITMKDEITTLDKIPSLVIIQVGDNEASNRYVRNKIKDCNEVGIKADLYQYPENITTNELVLNILDVSSFYDGIIVQLPLPPQIDFAQIKEYIPKKKDVDGFTLGSPFNPCTPAGIIKYLDYCNFDLDGKNVVICGRSEIVGKPLARMMEERNVTVTLCHSHTRNVFDFYTTADLIVVAVGKAGFLNCYPIYVPVIDVGINFVDGHLVGDCINTENRDVTPVPGGVGLLTRCALLENVIKASKGE